MKKEKSPVLVIFCIFLLSLLIILPPVFRKYIPKEDINDKEYLQQERSKLVIVNCNRIYQDELYQVRSKTKYVDGVLDSNILTYQLLETLPEGFVPSQIAPTTTAGADLTYFKSLQGINVVLNANITTITLDEALLVNNPNDTLLIQYLQSDYELQKQSYESLGYNCNILES